MKKMLLIISILSILFLTSCGSISLNSWVCPDDSEFITCIEELDTPRKISLYMLDNFTYEEHKLWSPDPYTLWKTKKGDCNDFATFGIFAAHWHNYETYKIIISYKNTLTKHMIAVYVEDEGMSFSENRKNSCFLSQHWFNGFEEIVYYNWRYHLNYMLKGYIVYDYENNKIEEVYKDAK